MDKPVRIRRLFIIYNRNNSTHAHVWSQREFKMATIIETRKSRNLIQVLILLYYFAELPLISSLCRESDSGETVQQRLQLQRNNICVIWSSQHKNQVHYFSFKLLPHSNFYPMQFINFNYFSQLAPTKKRSCNSRIIQAEKHLSTSVVI